MTDTSTAATTGTTSATRTPKKTPVAVPTETIIVTESAVSTDPTAPPVLTEQTLPTTAASPDAYPTYWRIYPRVEDTEVSRGVLMGVVMSAVSPSPRAGIYANPTTITLQDTGASSIVFTLDGSAPSCGHGYHGPVFYSGGRLRIRAVGCYGHSATMGPAADFTYRVAAH